MSFQVDRIECGPARLFAGVTNPASGAPPTWVTHTAGVPSSGTEVGLTEGDTVVEIQSEKKAIEAEQFYAPVEVYMTTQSAKLTFTAKEMTVAALKLALDNIGQQTTGSLEGFYFGSGAGSFAVMKTSIFFSARRRDDPSKYIIGLLYRAYASKPLTLPMSRTKESTFPVELSALADVTRTPGDCIGQFYREL